jgi:hypothetical protein
MSTIPNLNGTLGATEIGAVLGTFLCGIQTLQTFNYFRAFPRDSVGLKTTVCMPTLQTSATVQCGLGHCGLVRNA